MGTKSDLAIRQQLETQHPIHGMLGRVYERVGGEDMVVEWAEENPGAFIRLFIGTTPSMQPMNHVQGDVHLHVHHALAPTELDGSNDVIEGELVE